MDHTKTRFVDRALAMLLSIVMMIAMLPISVLHASAVTTEYAESFTVTVTDGEGPIQDADVHITAEKAEASWTLDLSGKTGPDGKATFDAAKIKEALNAAGLTTAELVVEVSKTGYDSNFVNYVVDSSIPGKNVDVILKATAPEQATVSVAVTGDAAVELNGTAQNAVVVNRGEEVSVKITPAKGAYIQSLTVAGESKEVAKGEAYEGTVTADRDIAIAATVVKEFTVTASGSKGGKIMLNDQEADTITVDENTEITVSVTADAGYQLSSVAIGGAAQALQSETAFTKKITVTEDIDITAEFVKVYTVTVKSNGGHGQIVTDPNGKGGVVTVESGADVKIIADPDENYRVSEVKINNVADKSVTGENFSNTDVYEKVLKADQDYTVEVTFAPNRYKITKDKTKNGTITLSSELVDYGSSCNVTVIPDKGYSVKTIKINGKEPTVIKEHDDGSVEVFIDNIKEAKKISATFVVTEMSSAEILKMFNSGDAIRVDGMTYVFKRDSTVTFTTQRDGIKVFCGKEFHGGWNISAFGFDKSVAFTKTAVITEIQERYDRSWHKVKSLTGNLKIVIDENPAVVSVASNDPSGNRFYSQNFDVKITASDMGDYSGISKVEYFVTDDEFPENTKYEDVPDEQKTQSGVIYDNADKIINRYNEKLEIQVSEERNNSDNVVVWVKVTDRAGNVQYDKSAPFYVNCIPPTLNSVTINGTLGNGATAGYYNSARTASIVITDRASCFDADAATAGISITAKDAAGEDVIISKPAMVMWNSQGDVHTGTVTFETDANYTWSIDYINRAGMAMNKTSVVETGDSIYSFAVDNEAPAGTISFDTGDSWDQLLSDITFGIWSRNGITVTAEPKDAISPTYAAQYYLTDSEQALSKAELEEAYKLGHFSEKIDPIKDNRKVVAYARLTDYAGNACYIGTNGAVVDVDGGKITLTPEEPNLHGFYNKDVKVTVEVSELIPDKAAYSGIKTIDYKVVDTIHDKVTQSGNLYTFDVENPKYSDLKAEWNNKDNPLVVDAKKNNCDNVQVIVTVKDNADNEYQKHISLAINIDPVTAKVVMNGKANEIHEERGYFKMEARTATITIKDRAASFDAAAATAGIHITAVDAAGAPVENAYTISDWISDGNSHTAIITFTEDANYDWSFKYKNKADNPLKSIDAGDSVTPFKFTLDDTTPTGTISVNTNKWDKLLNVITFGLYSNVKADITATAQDATSPVVIEYYKTDNPEALTAEELDSKPFVPYKDFSIAEGERFVIYLKITDYAGNYIYINSDGYIVDKEPSNVYLTPSAANGFYDQAANKEGQYGIYNQNSDVTVDVKVKDAEPYSGIKTVDYWIESDGVKKQEGNLFTFDQAAPAYSELVNEWSGTIAVDKEANNSCNAVVYVRTLDNAGNEKIESVKLDIDGTAPVIDVTFDNGNDNNGNTYFDAQRTATVVITERSHHFDRKAATKGIIINAVDAEGNPVEDAYTISDWTTAENEENPDAATHTATISFKKDANYTWSIAYTDIAGNANEGVNTSVVNGYSVAAFDFTVDTTSPFGTVKAVSTEGRETQWDSLRKDITFGFWSKKAITISGTSDDLTSGPIGSVEYYKVKSTSGSDGTEALTAEELDEVKDWTAFDVKTASDRKDKWFTFAGLSVESDEQFTVYVKITDLAGNYAYLSTNGLIVDHTAPITEVLAPEITVKPQQPINGIYKGDVKVDIKVVDPLKGGTYSGLKTVKYKVLNMGTETQSGTLYAFKNDAPKQSDLCQTWTGEITVDSELNNSNEVRIVVYAEDNATNSSEKEKEIKIDTTKPTVQITYDNNSADSGKYFRNNRTATIVVTERNFDADNVKLSITNTDGSIPALSGWTKGAAGGNEDGTTWTATLSYTADGDYEFGMECTDLAGNTCTDVSYGGSVAPTAFTIDKTVPVIAVTYDNNDARNTNYYKAERTATVVITEHNLDPNGADRDRIQVTVSASDDGAEVTAPAISGWNTVGDRHTAVIRYAQDARYSFDIAVKDKAGNVAADYPAETFYVDKTAPKLEITGVKNHSANNGDVIPVVSYSDTNIDENQVKITLTGANRKAVKLEGTYEDLHNGCIFTFNNFAKEQEIDDIYTLAAKLVDKAGNESAETITFSVNRFGSTYALSDATEQLNGTYVQTPVDVVVTETNPNKLSNIKLTLFKNNETLILTEGVDYAIEMTGGNGQWYHYTYTVFAKNFEDEGVYRLTFHSEDSAGNVAENTLDTKDTEIGFGIDKTKPNIVVSNLKSGKTYDVEKLTAEMTVQDNLILSELKVYLDDYDTVYQSWTAEEISEIIDKNGEFTFDILGDKTFAHNLKIVAVDAAGNEQVQEITEFYVTTNSWVVFYNNKPLFFGSITGVVLVIGLIVFLVVYKKKKDDK